MLTAAAAWFSFQELQPDIERDLTVRVAVVTAPVENEAAEEVVVVEEVTVVNESEENTITTEEETPLVIADNKTVAAPPSLTITSRDGKVTAQGIVADAGTIERITTVLTGKFGSNNGRLLGADLNVIDNLTVQIPRPELEAAPQAVAEIEDKAEDVTDADARQPEETLVADSEIEATVANEEPEADELTVVDSTESPAWINDVLIVTSEIRDVPDFSINIRGGQMSLSGDVEDRETARDLAIEATEIAGENLGVLNNFSVTAVKLEDSEEDLMGLSLLQELEALPTKDILFTKNSTTLTETTTWWRETSPPVDSARLVMVKLHQ